MPCPGCGRFGEPALRKPRPFSPEAERNPGTYFGCSGCGHVLARLSGPAALRPSDVPLDRLPDPRGLIGAAFLPELQRALARWANDGGDPRQLVTRLVGSGLAVARDLDIPVLEGLRLPGRERIVPSLILAGLGHPWLVTFCEIPGATRPLAPETIAEVVGLPTVEAAIRLAVVEENESVRIRLRLVYPDGEDPVPLEGNPLSFRRRREGCGVGPARRSDRRG